MKKFLIECAEWFRWPVDCLVIFVRDIWTAKQRRIDDAAYDCWLEDREGNPGFGEIFVPPSFNNPAAQARWLKFCQEHGDPLGRAYRSLKPVEALAKSLDETDDKA